MNRIFRALRSTARSRIARIATSILLSSEIAVIAQTFTTLYSFNGTGGANPHAPLVQGNNGNLYGTTANGAIENRGGTIYEITPGGALTTRYQFCSQAACADGAHAVAGLTQAPNFFLYGATSQGGARAFGTVFESTPNGAVVTEYSFCSQPACTDGAYPSAGLAQAFNGTLYGTTSQGGAQGQGTVFRITPDGAFTTLYSFCAQPSCADGANPDSGLVQTVNEDGDFYGTTPQGGSANHGTLFKITTDGLLTTLYDFCSEPLCADGSEPNVGLVKAYDTSLYGTTTYGGGKLRRHYLLVQGTDHNFYGTTFEGETYNSGVIFSITPDGVLTPLYSFCSQTGCQDGSQPQAGLFQNTNGDFYGTRCLRV